MAEHKRQREEEEEEGLQLAPCKNHMRDNETASEEGEDEREEEVSDTEQDACCDCTPDCTEWQVPVLDLHPTQLAVGMYQVSFKCGRFKQMHKDGRLDEYLRSHPIPVIRGPGGKLYLTDHHHLASALLKLQSQLGKKGRGLKPYVSLANKQLGRSDWHRDEEATEAFWADLLEHKCAWGADESGQKLPPGVLAERMRSCKDVTALKDDPYRSLAAYVRYAKGYKKAKPNKLGGAGFGGDKGREEGSGKGMDEGGGKGGENGGGENGGGMAGSQGEGQGQGGASKAEAEATDLLPPFFLEFKWGQYLRGKMPQLAGEPDNAQVLEEAIRWAKHPDAAGLPGYKGGRGKGDGA